MKKMTLQLYSTVCCSVSATLHMHFSWIVIVFSLWLLLTWRNYLQTSYTDRLSSQMHHVFFSVTCTQLITPRITETNTRRCVQVQPDPHHATATIGLACDISSAHRSIHAPAAIDIALLPGCRASHRQQFTARHVSLPPWPGMLRPHKTKSRKICALDRQNTTSWSSHGK
jgi:hypothetical protein